MHLFNVRETFQITGRGIIVISDLDFESLPSNFKVKIGDPIEVVENSRIILKTSVAGIEHCDPWTSKHPFAILLPLNVLKEDVPLGSEIRSQLIGSTV